MLLSFIIFGGVKRIASFSSMIVPFMALGYIIVACVINAINIDQLPSVILLIWKSASGLEAGFGAILGQAIMWGVKRGVYSNEAAQGSGPHASSAAASGIYVRYYNSVKWSCTVPNRATGGCSCSSGLNSILINTDSQQSCSGGKNDRCKIYTKYFYSCV